MNPRFLVTGAGGFIGAWVMRELLRSQIPSIGLDRSIPPAWWQHLSQPESAGAQARFVQGDILDAKFLADLLDREAISHIIHLVGLLTPACQQDPVRGCEINVLGTTRLFELLRARRAQIHGIAYASSYAVHGPAGGTAENPETFYGVFKRAVEQIARQYHRHFGLSSAGLRPFVVYGAGREQGISAAPSLAAKAAAAGESYAFDFSGAAGLVYVGDVARAFVRLALEARPGWNLIDMPGQDTTMEEVVELLERIRPGTRARLSITGPPLPPTREERPRLLTDLFQDWKDTPLEIGLRATVDMWHRLRLLEPKS